MNEMVASSHRAIDAVAMVTGDEEASQTLIVMINGGWSFGMACVINMLWDGMEELLKAPEDEQASRVLDLCGGMMHDLRSWARHAPSLVANEKVVEAIEPHFVFMDIEAFQMGMRSIVMAQKERKPN